MTEIEFNLFPIYKRSNLLSKCQKGGRLLTTLPNYGTLLILINVLILFVTFLICTYEWRNKPTHPKGQIGNTVIQATSSVGMQVGAPCFTSVQTPGLYSSVSSVQFYHTSNPLLYVNSRSGTRHTVLFYITVQQRDDLVIEVYVSETRSYLPLCYDGFLQHWDANICTALGKE